MQPANAPYSIDVKSSALLVMDYQNEIVERVQETERKSLLASAKSMLTTARKVGMPVIYIVVKFRTGYPEVGTRNKGFSLVKANNRLLEGSAGADIHADVAPAQSDLVLTKVRVGAFSTTALDTILRARGVTSLVMGGIATSGVVLSTVRWAADADYALTVVSDACADFNADTHRVLLENVFPMQASVVTAATFKTAAGG